MAGKKNGYQSLSDAKDLLKNLVDQSRNPPVAPASNFAPDDIEQALIRKAQASEAGSYPDRAWSKGSEPENTSPRHGEPRQGRQRNRTKKGQKKARRPEDILKTPEALEAYRQYVEAQQQAWLASQAAQAPKQNGFVDPRIKRSEIFERIRKVVGHSSPHVEDRPSVVSAETAAGIEASIAYGARAYADAPAPDDDGFIVGFDFGTSSLKLAVRQPYHARDWPEFRPTPPELRSGEHSYLWQTALWFDPEKLRFSLYPRTGFRVFEGFKTGIVAGEGGKLISPDQPVTRIEAAIAFIALQLAHFFGWYHKERPLGETGANRHLSINVGIPVASLDDERAFRDFRRILAVASEVLPFASDLDLPLVRQAYQQSGDELPKGWDLVPELTAAIAGYAAEPTSQAGAHVLVDVGASTLDIVAFNHVRGERVAVISAAVELLGSASLESTREAGIPDGDFKAACDHQFEKVFGEACQYARGAHGFSPTRRARDVQLVTTGGGCASPLHAEFISEMNVEGVLGASSAVRPEPPAPSVTESCDRARLLLAYGLTRDFPERPDLRAPSQVPSINSPQGRPDNFISKDML